MAYFKIVEPNKPTKYIKTVDALNEKLTFSKNRDGCHYKSDGYYANAELDYLKFHFMEKYPELKYMKKEVY